MKKLENLNLKSFTNQKENKMKVEIMRAGNNGKLSLGSFKLIFGMLAMAIVLLFTACEEDATTPQSQEQNIIPERFKIDIPESLSSSNSLKSGRLKSAESDTLQGNEIYESLKMFIAIGEGAADITEAIIWSIRAHNIENVQELTYESDEDGRIKHLVVNKGVSFDNRDWEYQLTVTDLEDEGNADGGIGMQVFWNSSPIEGIALIKPFNTNRNDADENGEAIFSVEYSEKATESYDAHMIVQIANLPTNRIRDDRYAVDAIKMFVGKKGDIVDVYGNSNHPNAKFFTDETGFNWAFVASGAENRDIAVAEVALPPSTLNSTSREVILKEYSLKNVFTNQISLMIFEQYGFYPDSLSLSSYLKNADAPGYFNNDGFIQGGTAPSDAYGEIELRLNALTPYNPKDISELTLDFLR